MKFYDTNRDGLLSEGEVGIVGWKIQLYRLNGDYVLYDTTYTDEDGGYYFADLPRGTYKVVEVLPNSSWMATTVTEYAGISINGTDVTGKDFGNVCMGSGGLTPGFWSNKNGEAVFNANSRTYLSGLKSLNLKDVTSRGVVDFDPGSYAVFRDWLVNRNAVEMEYQLSAQLASMWLNVQAGFVSGNHYVYEEGLGFITIGDLLTRADLAMGRKSVATRAELQLLKNALDHANNNMNFLQPRPCPFEYLD
jgi:hypothetical protein